MCLQGRERGGEVKRRKTTQQGEGGSACQYLLSPLVLRGKEERKGPFLRRRWVGPSLRPSLGRSVGRSVGWVRGGGGFLEGKASAAASNKAGGGGRETQVEHTQYAFGGGVVAWGIHDHKRSLMQIGRWRRRRLEWRGGVSDEELPPPPAAALLLYLPVCRGCMDGRERFPSGLKYLRRRRGRKLRRCWRCMVNCLVTAAAAELLC